MPNLNFHDVFLEEKEDVLFKIKEMEQQIYGLSIAVTAAMLEKNTKEMVVYKEDFMRSLDRAGLSEPVELTFKGQGNRLEISIATDEDDDYNGNSNPWK